MFGDYRFFADLWRFNVSVENVVEGYCGYGFGYDEGKWFSTIIITIRPTAISKEDYIEMRKESD